MLVQVYGPRHDKTNKMCVHPAIRVFAVRMKKPWVLRYTLSGQGRLWSDWAHLFCWFCHVVAHIQKNKCYIRIMMRLIKRKQVLCSIWELLVLFIETGVRIVKCVIWNTPRMNLRSHWRDSPKHDVMIYNVREESLKFQWNCLCIWMTVLFLWLCVCMIVVSAVIKLWEFTDDTVRFF